MGTNGLKMHSQLKVELFAKYGETFQRLTNSKELRPERVEFTMNENLSLKIIFALC